jgi:hypothetical protein
MEVAVVVDEAVVVGVDLRARMIGMICCVALDPVVD